MFDLKLLHKIVDLTYLNLWQKTKANVKRNIIKTFAYMVLFFKTMAKTAKSEVALFVCKSVITK